MDAYLKIKNNQIIETVMNIKFGHGGDKVVDLIEVRKYGIIKSSLCIPISMHNYAFSNSNYFCYKQIIIFVVTFSSSKNDIYNFGFDTLLSKLYDCDWYLYDFKQLKFNYYLIEVIDLIQ